MHCLYELQGIRFSYPNLDPVLTGVDLCVERGERIALTGSNGAGKSTLLHIMVGLLKPDAGRLIAFGTERHLETDFREVRQRTGFVFQDPDDQLFCPTVVEDIAFGPLNLGKSKEQALAIVDETLGQLRLDHLRDRITHKLSGGEKRLVSLASVLAMQPEVLLLDEPTNALDEQTRKRLVQILGDLPQTLIVISHDAHFRREVTGRQLHLEGGRINAHRPRCPHAI